MKRIKSKAARLLRNVVTDFRHGGWLGGTVSTRYAAAGAHDTMNTDYGALPFIFPVGELPPSATLVDLGCGKGRVLNWWLDHGRVTRASFQIVGVELDPDVARQVRRRLSGEPNVRVITGPAQEVLVEGAVEPDVIFMFNPFSRVVMEKVEQALRGRSAVIYYYHPLVLEPWDRPEWVIEERNLPKGRGFHRLAIIRRSSGA